MYNIKLRVKKKSECKHSVGRFRLVYFKPSFTVGTNLL